MLTPAFQYFNHVTERIVNVNRGGAISMFRQCAINLRVSPLDCNVRRVLPMEDQCQINVTESEHRLLPPTEN